MNKKRDPEGIASIVNSVLAERGYLTVCKEFAVCSKWPEIVGPRLSKVTECKNVENGVLYVKVSSSSWRQEITYLKKKIIDQIHKETGCTSITDIVFC